ncbi:uncharacterized protein LOC124419282, partial [Lucilia cuprina]|uniref:uncharacterized protein LOC124419282 n=1 Tax=Lucilia cuprina TaxID=7375 RepID=UPI001F0682BF
HESFFDYNHHQHLIKYNTASKQTSPLLSSPSSTSSSSQATVITSSPSTSSSSESLNNVDPEVGSIFGFEPHILQPFMGLHSVDHPDDPWHHKAYDPYQPLFTGGGTFEEYLKNGRYKRDLRRSTQISKNRNTLTPEMLERLLRIKSSFKKNYPALYKTMMGQLTGGKSTTITVTPPEVPQHVSYRNVELAAAEINPLETLIDTYEQDLQNILEAQQQKQRQQESHEPLINPYTNEFNFWGNSQEEITSNTPQKDIPILQQTLEQLDINPRHDQTSFWENPEEILKTVNEDKTLLASPENHTPNKPQTFWENSEETLKTLAEPQLFLENREQNLNEHLVENNFHENINETQSYWENSEETLKTLSEHKVFLDKPQEAAIEEQNFWEETPEKIVNDVQSLPHETLNSVNEEQNFWETPTLSLEASALQKRSNSFWDELEAEEEQHEDHNSDDLEPIFDFDEDFD